MVDTPGPAGAPGGPHRDISIQQRYHKDLKEGVKLFQEALHSYETTQDPKKKYEFKKVMDESLKAIHQAVVCIKNSELQKQEAKLHADYNDIEKNPDRVKHDIESFRKSL